jgi:outer membrane protein OmpA-like peptidoglycan-associated protein
MQMTGQFRAVLLACLAVLTPHQAHAEDAILAITMTGEAYEGAPKFKILADAHTIGTGEIAHALDASKGNRLKLPTDLERSTTERFLFAVPDIQNVSQFEIVFTNDAWAGKGKPGDRNLYVLGLSLSVVKKDATGAVAEARDFSPQQLEAITRSPGGAAITPRYSALFQDGRLRLKRPQGGWTASAGITKPAQTTTPQPNANPPCRRARFELGDFAKNSTALSPAMREQLERVKGAFSPSCTARVTAYVRGGPSDAFRAELSLTRAEAVARELARLGMARERIKTVSGSGGGRRVIISIE